MDIEQAAITATNVRVEGDVGVIIHRDNEDPTVICIIICDDTVNEIVHEVNIKANSHMFTVTKDLKRLVEYK